MREGRPSRRWPWHQHLQRARPRAAHIISIDSDDERRKGVIETFDSDDGARRVTTDAIDLTWDSDDEEGPRKRQRTAGRRGAGCRARPRIQVIRNYGGAARRGAALLSEAAERRLLEYGTRCPYPPDKWSQGTGAAT